MRRLFANDTGLLAPMGPTSLAHWSCHLSSNRKNNNSNTKVNTFDRHPLKVNWLISDYNTQQINTSGHLRLDFATNWSWVAYQETILLIIGQSVGTHWTYTWCRPKRWLITQSGICSHQISKTWSRTLRSWSSNYAYVKTRRDVCSEKILSLPAGIPWAYKMWVVFHSGQEEKESELPKLVWLQLLAQNKSTSDWFLRVQHGSNHHVLSYSISKQINYQQHF